MRETHTAQASIFQTTTDHEIAYELKRMSDWLDAHPELLDLIAADLQSGGGSSCGRRGMTLESILRCAILKQYRQVDYRTLVFYLRDSVSFIEFARRSAATIEVDVAGADQCDPGPDLEGIATLLAQGSPSTGRGTRRGGRC